MYTFHKIVFKVGWREIVKDHHERSSDALMRTHGIFDKRKNDTTNKFP